ncbi:hypothetical protein PR202_gb13015 [Eleusine coracana subsp. coracana]|uniref:Rx N-terminal domain-containing protein n=1 Tax=Eleusine coracana subsp. coracana TaxID=191504 RepID=A0AAV5ET00_ELECO|nr:hypothetical protein PR202_gb13015 [Eleusine coracana subsp. coracana]
MAEMVSSAVAQEAVNQVLSSIKDRYEGNSGAKGHMERMEMAHIKLEAALETSNNWNVTSAPLIHWRSKLKRAQECDGMLRSCKKRLQEEEKMEDRTSSGFLMIISVDKKNTGTIFIPFSINGFDRIHFVASSAML